jgi:hypothetical protein
MNLLFVKHKQYKNTWIIVACAVLMACMGGFFSCNDQNRVKYRTYEVYANDDIALTTETGEMVFIPYGALQRDGEIYHGKVIIKLSPYKRLLDSLSRFTRKGKFIHPLQLTSAIVDCTDDNGKSLKINVRSGYQMLIFMPLAPAVARKYEDSLITAADDIFLKEKSFDSFDVNVDKRQIPPFENMQDLFALWRRVPKYGLPDYRADAGLVYNKSNSIKALKHFLQVDLPNATGMFLRSAGNTANKELQTQQSDLPSGIPFICFNILELYNRTGNTGLLEIFTEHRKDWENSLLIVDWTGSMQIHKPEILELLKSLYLKGTIRHIVLYNDNEDPGVPSLQDTEGFFYIDSVESFSQVEKLMAESESDYWGGDHLEESDYSALIRATSGKSPPWRSDYKQIIMLIDNNAPPRDTARFGLIDINKKIVVIAYDANDPCDVDINYHHLVRKFGGLLYAEGSRTSHDCQVKNEDSCVRGSARFNGRPSASSYPAQYNAASPP